MKFFVTGDNHIGLKYSNHEAAQQLIAYRTAAFKNMVDAANREKCSIFVITGDLFDRNYSISKGDIMSLLDMLSCFNGTVAILPGNHDYYDVDVQLWQDFETLMQSYDNIMLLKEYRPYEISVDGEKVILYPAHCTSKHSEPFENNLGWIKEAKISDDGAYNIGVVHGSVEGETIDNEGKYFLMKRQELESIPMDAWFVGHTHVPFPNNLTDAFSITDKILNPGTHVQTDVSCNTEGQCFIVEIDKDKTVRAKKYESGNIRFYRKEISLRGGEMEAILKDTLESIDDNSVVELILSGAVTDEEYSDKNEIIENLLSRFIEHRWNDSELGQLISKELIVSEFPETSFSAGLLTALLDEPKEAQLAYELLKKLREEK